MVRSSKLRVRFPSVVVAVAMLLTIGSPLQGRQAVQATVAIAREVNEQYERDVQAWVGQWVLAYSKALGGRESAPLMLLGMSAAEEILTYTGDAIGLARLVEKLERMLNALPDEQITAMEQTRPASIPPQLFVINDNVVFAIGLSVSFGEETRGHISLGTNLLGSALGSAVDVFGAGGLGEYLKANISAGPVFPVGGGELSGQLGVGLGEVRVRSLAFWPVLSLAELKADDSSLPRAIFSEFPDQPVWSYPLVGLALDTGWLDGILQDSGLGFVVTLGVALPFYYPGGVTGALGALFSDSRGDYVRGGGVGGYLGVSTPLFQVKRKEGVRQGG